MQVFKITCKFEQNSSLRELTGYFVKRDGDDVIEGYVVTQADMPAKPVKRIKGIYTEVGRLTFLQEEIDSIPICYDFKNVDEQASSFTYAYTRAQVKTTLYSYAFKELNEGLAQVQLEKVDAENERMRLTREITELHSLYSQSGSEEGRYLMKVFKEVLSIFIEKYC